MSAHTRHEDPSAAQVWSHVESLVLRIAVVDSDETLLELLAQVFQAEGWELLPFTDARACEVLPREVPDLIIVEPWLAVPNDGWPILECVHRHPSLHAVPFLVWTSSREHLGDRVAWLAERGIPLLIKPFALDDLLHVIHGALDREQPG